MKIVLLVRSIIITLFFPMTVVLVAPLAIIFHILFNSRKLDDKMIMIWGRFCCAIANVKVSVKGLENIPPDRGCLFLFNHSSFFDVFAIAGFLPGVRFGAKAELFKIPLFGATMKIMGTLPIARNNREEVYKVYEDAKSRFSHNEKFALAPEGGRYFGPHLGPFKAGPFIFAMSAEAPLLPVVILGAYECLPKGKFLFNKGKWSRHIELQILPLVETKGFKHDQRSILQNQVYAAMDPLWHHHFVTHQLDQF